MAGVPGSDPDHRLMTTRAAGEGVEGRGSVVGYWVGRFELNFAEPGGLLGLREHGGLMKQGAHTVEGASARRMEPAEATDAMEACGQDVLEEAAEEFEGFQIDVDPLAGGGVAIGPAQSARGEEE